MHQKFEGTVMHSGHELEINGYSTADCVRCGASCMKAGSLAQPDEYDLWRLPGETEYYSNVPECVTIH